MPSLATLTNRPVLLEVLLEALPLLLAVKLMLVSLVLLTTALRSLPALLLVQGLPGADQGCGPPAWLRPLRPAAAAAT